MPGEMLETGLSTALVSWLLIGLSPPPPGVAETATEHNQAGREAVKRRTYEDLQNALAHFREALALDPDNGPAYAGLADAYALLADYARAERAALKALELDDTLAAAHASLAFVRLHGDWDWSGAQQEFERAIALDPDYATAHHWYAIYLEAMGRNEEAIDEARAALELEPTSDAYRLGLGYRLFWARRYEEAVEELERLLADDPVHSSAHYFLGRCYAEQGRFRKALEALEEAHRLSPRNVNVSGALGYLHARSGRRSEARRHLRELEHLSRRGYPLATHIASIHTAWGDFDSALRWLQTAYETREGPLVWLRVDPRFDPLRSEARFKALLRGMKLSAAGGRGRPEIEP